jgi:glycerophosphoryl diester phosphodiesterase
MLNIAHRGASGYYPENTLIAFQRAVELGADMIELDVHLTKDGEVVVIHDETLDRTTNGKGNVRDYTLPELKKLDAGAWYKSEFAGERIPTLEEVLQSLKGKVQFNIEIKNGPVYYQGIEEKILAILLKQDLRDQVVISSFDHRCLKKIKKMNPDLATGSLVKLGVLYVARLLKPEKIAQSVGATGLHLHKSYVTPDLVHRAKQHGLRVLVWTVNEPAQMSHFIKMGVDGIVTNFPDKLKNERENLKRTKGF